MATTTPNPHPHPSAFRGFDKPVEHAIGADMRLNGLMGMLDEPDDDEGGPE